MVILVSLEQNKGTIYDAPWMVIVITNEKFLFTQMDESKMFNIFNVFQV